VAPPILRLLPLTGVVLPVLPDPPVTELSTTTPHWVEFGTGGHRRVGGDRRCTGCRDLTWINAAEIRSCNKHSVTLDVRLLH
jgi:hypothetical protein